MTIATKEKTTMEDVAAALAIFGDYSVATATTPRSRPSGPWTLGVRRGASALSRFTAPFVAAT